MCRFYQYRERARPLNFFAQCRNCDPGGGAESLVVEVVSSVIDTSNPAFLALSLWIRRRSDAFSEDPDGSENLVVEYLDHTGTWTALETFSGTSTMFA